MPVLFTDVDGTFLDDDGVAAASPDRLAEIQAHLLVIAASSRTVIELQAIQHRTGLTGPCIAEDGAAIARGSRVERLGAPAEELRRALAAECRRHGIPVPTDAPVGAGREASLLFPRQTLDDSAVRTLRPGLARQGIGLRGGGRWWVLTGGADKGTAARALLDRLRQTGMVPACVGAVGNEENDLPLLHAADRAYVIRNPRTGHHPELAALPTAHALRRIGTAGWLEAVEDLIGKGIAR